MFQKIEVKCPDHTKLPRIPDDVSFRLEYVQTLFSTYEYISVYAQHASLFKAKRRGANAMCDRHEVDFYTGKLHVEEKVLNIDVLLCVSNISY